MVAYRRVYQVSYVLRSDTGPNYSAPPRALSLPVHLTDGYTNFESIRKILAVSHFSTNEQWAVDSIEITALTLTGKEEIGQ
jgi:hypothetical protein